MKTVRKLWGGSLTSWLSLDTLTCLTACGSELLSCSFLGDGVREDITEKSPLKSRSSGVGRSGRECLQKFEKLLTTPANPRGPAWPIPPTSWNMLGRSRLFLRTLYQSYSLTRTLWASPAQFPGHSWTIPTVPVDMLWPVLPTSGDTRSILPASGDTLDQSCLLLKTLLTNTVVFAWTHSWSWVPFSQTRNILVIKTEIQLCCITPLEYNSNKPLNLTWATWLLVTHTCFG